MTLNKKLHAKKDPKPKVKRTLAEKRKRPVQGEASAARASREWAGAKR